MGTIIMIAVFPQGAEVDAFGEWETLAGCRCQPSGRCTLCDWFKVLGMDEDGQVGVVSLDGFSSFRH